MPTTPSPLTQLQARLGSGDITPAEIAADSLARSNTNASHNVYIIQDAHALHEQAAALTALEPAGRKPLFAVPVSLKDCFDLSGTTTTCGSRFYANINAPATEDSWIAAQLKRAGVLLTGKTHLHQLAYGITGQNADYGDCLQPNNPALLTGGSSSGAAASVQEGSALAAIGTDTGGSIRGPAALCGLAGYRASIDLSGLLPGHPDIWQGAVHLAGSFDTIGLLFRDLRDGPALAEAIFGLPTDCAPILNPRIATVPRSFLHDAEPAVLAAYEAQQQSLLQAGATLYPLSAQAIAYWSEAVDIFAPIQAHEAAHIQRGKLYSTISDASFNALDLNLPSTMGLDFYLPTLNPSALTLPTFEVFEPAIAERLAWGESISNEEIAALRLRHTTFREQMDLLFNEHDLLLLPCSPVCQLRADADHTDTRPRVLRYMAPVSLAGMPAVTLPQPGGSGMQLVAARGRDAALLAFAATQFAKE